MNWDSSFLLSGFLRSIPVQKKDETTRVTGYVLLNTATENRENVIENQKKEKRRKSNVNLYENEAYREHKSIPNDILDGPTLGTAHFRPSGQLDTLRARPCA